jgi:hypothetical protein
MRVLHGLGTDVEEVADLLDAAAVEQQEQNLEFARALFRHRIGITFP